MDDEESVGEALSRGIRARVHKELLGEVGRQELPEGTITVVFTDVEGSSELVRDLGDGPAHRLLRRHDQIVRDTLRTHDGTEVEHPGDSFMLAFRTARAALAFALDLQRALAEERSERPETPNVRIGLDTGEVIAEDSGYFGSTVFRAARIADVARGGQVLASEVTRLLALPAGFSFRDGGTHELRGLGGSHRLFEAVDGPKPEQRAYPRPSPPPPAAGRAARGRAGR